MADIKFSEFQDANDTDISTVVGLQNNLNVKIPVASIVDGMIYETMAEATYNSEQSPPALNTPVLIKFNDTGSPIVSADGTITINTDGSIDSTNEQSVSAVIKFQIGKVGSSGSVDFISYTTVEAGGTEMVIGEPIHIEFGTDQFNTQKDISRAFQVPGNATLRFYWFNDSLEGGNNSASLQSFVCTPGTGPNGEDLPPVPSASISIGKYRSGVK